MRDTYLLVQELEVRAVLVQHVVLPFGVLRPLLRRLLRVLRLPVGVLVRPVVVRAVVVARRVVRVVVLEGLLAVCAR